METHDERDTGLPWLTIVIVGALALFGAITLLQWVVGAVLGLIKLAIFAAVVIALGAALFGALARR